jgi:hypothetical protein
MCARRAGVNEVSPRFVFAVGGGAFAIVVGIVVLRFCGALSLPPKPPKPAPPTIGAAEDILAASAATPAAWQAFIEKDAAAAGIATPGVGDLSRPFPYKVDEKKRELVVGGPPIDAAGLRLSLEVAEPEGSPVLALVIENLADVDVAYSIATRPSRGSMACQTRDLILHDGMAIGARDRERRSECEWKEESTLHVDRVETIELPPLSAWYVRRVPPAAVSLDTRLHRGHKPRAKMTPCNVMMSQAIRSALETGETTWRDLVDFYARHRCDTYQFPKGYKAFKEHNQYALPVVAI